MKAEQLASHGSSVLIVEDDPDLSLALDDYLQHEGYTVRSVASGRQALREADRKTVTGKIRSLIALFGRDRVAIAYARACAMEGAKHSRAGRKAAETKGVAGLKVAADRAAATRKRKGVQ